MKDPHRVAPDDMDRESGFTTVMNTDLRDAGSSPLSPLSATCRGLEAAGSRALQSRDGARLAPDIRERLLIVLFGKASNIVVVALAIVMVGAVAYVRHATSSAAMLSVSGFTFLLARSALVMGFDRHRLAGHVVDVDRWLFWFGTLAIASSACWGLLTLVCMVASHDPVLYVLALVCNYSTAGAIAARNGAFPRVAIAQLLASLGPSMIGCLFADDLAYGGLSCLTPGLFYGLLLVASDTHQHLVGLFQVEKELSRLSYIDGLTGAYNRRYFDQELDRRLLAESNAGRAIGLVMIDVDFFKPFNDHHGHPAGDRCLRSVTSILQGTMSAEGDMVCRYGGEEFAIVLTRGSRDDIVQAAQVLCRSVSAAALPHGGRRDGTDIVTISLGVAVTPDRRIAAQDLVTAADGALYMAKCSGRNRCHVAD